MLKLYVSTQLLPKRSGASFLLMNSQTQVKLNEIYIILNKTLGKYDNILLARYLNTDELKTGSDSSNHLSDAKDVFNLINLVKKPTCFKSQAGTLIDLMLTNRPRSFLKSQNFEIGLSDCGNLLVFKSLFQKTSEKNHNLQIEIKSVITRTIFLKIGTVDYYKGSLTEILMSLTKILLEFLTIYLIITSH